jgi:hypothetical protein
MIHRVARTLCVGNDDDLSCLVREMRSKRATALSKWVGEAWRGSQEDVYYEALMEVRMHADTAICLFQLYSKPTGLAAVCYLYFSEVWKLRVP